MAASADRRQAGDAHPVASKGFPVVVALEIAGPRATADSGAPAAIDRDDGGHESDLWRGTDCRRTPRQAWDSRLAADRATVHAVGTAAGEARHADVERVRAEPRAVGHRQ